MKGAEDFRTRLAPEPERMQRALDQHPGLEQSLKELCKTGQIPGDEPLSVPEIAAILASDREARAASRSLLAGEEDYGRARSLENDLAWKIVDLLSA